jgi:hypothetical protein
MIFIGYGFTAPCTTPNLGDLASVFISPREGLAHLYLWATGDYCSCFSQHANFHLNIFNTTDIQYHLAIVTLLQLLDTSRRVIKLHSISYCQYS